MTWLTSELTISQPRSARFDEIAHAAWTRHNDGRYDYADKPDPSPAQFGKGAPRGEYSEYYAVVRERILALLGDDEVATGVLRAALQIETYQIQHVLRRMEAAGEVDGRWRRVAPEEQGRGLSRYKAWRVVRQTCR